MLRFLLPTALLVIASLAAADAAAAARDCFPRLVDDVIVFFEPGETVEPIVVGYLWNRESDVPKTADDVGVLAPRFLAAALLDEVRTVKGRDDRSVGRTTRVLVETLAQELASAQLALEKAYEASFVDTATRGSLAAKQPRFVAELVQGVFEANLKASIEQMEAYADLLADVTESVDAFRDANAKEGEREWLRDELMILAAALIDLDLELRDPDCD